MFFGVVHHQKSSVQNLSTTTTAATTTTVVLILDILPNENDLLITILYLFTSYVVSVIIYTATNISSIIS